MPELHRLTAYFLGAFALALANVSAAGTSPPDVKIEKEALDLVPVEDYPPQRGWAGMQSIHADHDGNIYLFRSETLEVYPVDKRGNLAKPIQLHGMGLSGTPQIRLAAMNEPDEWILVGSKLRWFVDGKEVPIGMPDQPLLSAAYLDGRPVALLAPVMLHRKRGQTFEELPTLAVWDGDEWEALLVESVAEIEDRFGAEGRISRDSLLAPDADGAIWLAQIFKPRLRRFSSLGRLELELETDGGKSLDTSESQIATVKENLEGKSIGSRADDQPASKKLIVNPYRPFHRSLTVAGDGTVYLLITDPEKAGGCRLRRWNPVLYVLEEVALPVDIPGLASMAVGHDGLHIAQWDAAKGRIFLSDEIITSAKWRKVDGVKLDGELAPNSEGENPDK